MRIVCYNKSYKTSLFPSHPSHSYGWLSVSIFLYASHPSPRCNNGSVDGHELSHGLVFRLFTSAFTPESTLYNTDAFLWQWRNLRSGVSKPNDVKYDVRKKNSRRNFYETLDIDAIPTGFLVRMDDVRTRCCRAVWKRLLWTLCAHNLPRWVWANPNTLAISSAAWLEKLDSDVCVDMKMMLLGNPP